VISAIEPKILRIGLGIVLLLLAFAGSANDTKGPQLTDTSSRTQLDVGYSLLYQEAEGIPKIDWLVKFKNKPKEVGSLVDELVNFYQQLTQSMERLSNQCPAVRLDLKPMPDVESEARKSIGTDLAKDLVPVAGKSGIDFQREMLLMLYDSLNEQRHLVQVMSTREPQPGLKEFLETTKARLDVFHRKVGVELDRCCYRH
jgi:hypothetical protein